MSVLVPWADVGCEWRRAAWRYVERRYRRDHPSFEIVVGHSPGSEWSKGDALADAARRAHGDVFVVADADCLVGRTALNQALGFLADGAPWAIPYEEVRRMTAEGTAALLEAGQDASPAPGALLDRKAYDGVEGGGVVVLSRETWAAVPVDPRFVGWGGEDHSWGWALTTIVGAPVRAAGVLWHLWHPPAVPGIKQPRSTESMRLMRAYRLAQSSPRRMRGVVVGLPPAPPVVLVPPAEFRSRTPNRTVKIGRARVTFDGDGLAYVDDGDVAEMLVRFEGIERVASEVTGTPSDAT